MDSLFVEKIVQHALEVADSYQRMFDEEDGQDSKNHAEDMFERIDEEVRGLENLQESDDDRDFSEVDSWDEELADDDSNEHLSGSDLNDLDDEDIDQ